MQTIAIIDGWTLTEGLGPRVVGERAPDGLAAGMQVAVRLDGSMQLAIGNHIARRHHDEIPRSVLVALVRDAIARGVLTVEELTRTDAASEGP